MDPLPTATLPPDRREWLERTVLPLPGWCSPSKAVRLAELTIASRAQLSVDLGVFGARSTIALAEGHRLLGYGYVTGIDPWTRNAAVEGTNDLVNEEWWTKLDLEGIYRSALTSMQRHAALPHWQILRVHSRDGIGYFTDGSIDLLHQDSNHSPEVSQEELRLWIPKMRPGALFVMDDTNWPSLQETQKILQETYGAVPIEDHDIHSGSGLPCWRVFQLP